MKTLLIIIATTIFFLQSCIITQEIHINKDFSGIYKLKYDFSQMMNANKGMDFCDSD